MHQIGQKEGDHEVKYTVSITTKLKPPQSGLIVIEPEDYTPAEVQALKKSGAKVLAYLSIGSASNERKYYSTLEPFCLKKLEDWPHERYLDITQAVPRKWLQNQALALKKMGYDGWWLDNIDVYEEYRTTEMFNAMTAVIRAIKAVGGYVMLNGGIAYLTDLMIPHKVQLEAYKDAKNAKRMEKALKGKNFGAAIVEMDSLKKVQAGAFTKKEGADQLVKKLHAANFGSAKRITLFDGKASAFIDGVTQEEVFSLITDYKGSGTFGKQSQEESERYQAHMRRVAKNGIDCYLLEYTQNNVLKLRIKAFCDTIGATACISDDVDL